MSVLLNDQARVSPPHRVLHTLLPVHERRARPRVSFAGAPLEVVVPAECLLVMRHE